MPEFAFQGENVHTQEAFNELDTIFHCPIALRFVGLRFFFKHIDVELGLDQVSQREDCGFVVGLDDDFVSEPKAIPSAARSAAAPSSKTLLLLGTTQAWIARLWRSFRTSTVMTSVSSARLRKQ